MKGFMLLAVVLTFSSPAMAIDWSAPVLSPDGKPIADCEVDHPDCGKIATLGKIASTALFMQFPDEQSITGEEKFRRGALAMRIMDDKDYPLQAEDILRVKTAVAKGYSPLIVLRVWTAIDPSGKDK